MLNTPINKNKTLVSVIIPLFNGQNTIIETIESVIEQTYKNIEVIIIDDCSEDLSYRVVCDIIKNDSRFRVYKNSKNIGLPLTLNRAIKLSRGQYIARIDQDDIMEKSRIEVQFEYFKKHKFIDVLFSAYYRFYDRTRLLDKKLYSNDCLIKYEPNVHGSLLHSSIFAKKEALLQVKGYREETYPCDDYDLLLRLYENNFKIYILNKPLVRYRMHDSSNTINKFFLLRKKSRYVKHLAMLRRKNEPEINFHDYLRTEKKLKIIKDYGAFFYRKAGQYYLNRSYIKFLFTFVAGIFLNPTYIKSKIMEFIKTK